LLLAACSDTTEGQDAAASDSGQPDAGDQAVVEVGTGQDGFVAVPEGGMVDLTQGPQAGGGQFLGYHVFGAVRVRGLDPQQALIELTLVDDTGTEQAREERQVNMQPDGDWFVFYGAAPRIMDCCAVANRSATMRARVEDRNGMIGMDERTVTVGACIDNNTGANHCL
jgi:hypothetical protein